MGWVGVSVINGMGWVSARTGRSHLGSALSSPHQTNTPDTWKVLRDTPLIVLVFLGLFFVLFAVVGFLQHNFRPFFFAFFLGGDFETSPLDGRTEREVGREGEREGRREGRREERREGWRVGQREERREGRWEVLDCVRRLNFPVLYLFSLTISRFFLTNQRFRRTFGWPYFRGSRL